METDEEAERFEQRLKQIEIKKTSWLWRIGLLILIVLIIMGGYYL